MTIAMIHGEPVVVCWQVRDYKASHGEVAQSRG